MSPFISQAPHPSESAEVLQYRIIEAPFTTKRSQNRARDSIETTPLWIQAAKFCLLSSAGSTYQSSMIDPNECLPLTPAVQTIQSRGGYVARFFRSNYI